MAPAINETWRAKGYWLQAIHTLPYNIHNGKGRFLFGAFSPPVKMIGKVLTVFFSVERKVVTKNGTSEEISYYITSLCVSAEKLLETSREHWKIESMRWVLDVVFSEDSTAILPENSLKSLNILRKFALMAHKKYVLSQPRKKLIKPVCLIAC